MLTLNSKTFFQFFEICRDEKILQPFEFLDQSRNFRYEKKFLNFDEEKNVYGKSE